MPSRKKASLRNLRTTEAHLAHCTDRDKAHRQFVKHVDSARRHVVSAEALVMQLEEATSELGTALAVAQRHHEIRLQEIQNTTRFPDEDKDSN